MSKYLLIESRDPFEWNEVPRQYELAAGLAKEGNTVCLFLIQNGVLPARKSSKSDLLNQLTKAGVEVFADDFSLRERGISTASLAPGIKAKGIDLVVDQLAEGRKAIFH